MTEGSAGTGDSNMAMYGSKDLGAKEKLVERSPYSDSTNNCKECSSCIMAVQREGTDGRRRPR